jgi:hypothetical protein
VHENVGGGGIFKSYGCYKLHRGLFFVSFSTLFCLVYALCLICLFLSLLQDSENGVGELFNARKRKYIAGLDICDAFFYSWNLIEICTS